MGLSLKILRRMGPEDLEMIRITEERDIRAQQEPVWSLLIHIGNEAKRSKLNGYIQRLKGTKAGVVDWFLPVARGGYHGLWIELKIPPNQLTGAQEHWLNLMVEQGYFATMAISGDEVITTIETYLKLPPVRFGGALKAFGGKSKCPSN